MHPNSEDHMHNHLEIVETFRTEEAYIGHLARNRWPDGVQCLKCQGQRISQFVSKGKTGKARHLYECMTCKYQFSVTTGTLFHNTHVPLTKWFLAIWLIGSAKKGVSAKHLQRELAVSYKTAWYMARRIRLAMREDSKLCSKFVGTVEVDETYVGGKQSGTCGRGATNKVPA
jgi:transposase-like protein